MRVVLIHGSPATAGIADVIGAAGSDFIPGFLIQSAEESKAMTAVASQFAPSTELDLLSEGGIQEAASWLRAFRCDGILTFSDHLVQATERLRVELKLPGSSHCAPTRWLKDVQRQQLIRAGLFGGDVATACDRASLLDAARTVGFPVIVKPTAGAASVRILALYSEREALDYADTMTAGSTYVVETYLGASSLPQSPWLADYCSIESVSFSSHRIHFALTLRPLLAPPVRETGSVITNVLSTEECEAIASVADKALDALGVSNLATHTEIKLSARGNWVLEVNGRLGGYVERMSRETGGFSAVRAALASACDAPHLAGIPESHAYPHLPRKHVASLLLPPPTTAVAIERSPSRKSLSAFPGVLAVDRVRGCGPVDPFREGTNSYICSIWVAAASSAELFDRASAVALAAGRDTICRLEDGSVGDASEWPIDLLRIGGART